MSLTLGGFSFVEVGPRRYAITVAAQELRRVVEAIAGEEAYLSSISAVDMPKEGRIELNYIFWSIRRAAALVVKVPLDRGNPVVPSIADIVPAAVKSEIEVYDLMGVVFEGNRSLKRGFLVPGDTVAKGVYPLRKDSGV